MAVLGVAFPGSSAFAADGVINPSGGNAWDLYVFGNGQVVYHIFMGLKMLMMADAGHTGFTTLLLLMATLGFLVMAISAGFNPGKNFVPMFGYILVVWLVTWSSTKLAVNVNINDLVVTENGYTETRSVSGVPALVGLPASLTSEVGRYFTTTLETYMSVPNAYLMSQGAVGQFNLFAKMADDITRVRFTDANVKMALSAYIADCAIPAIALGRLEYTAGKVPLYGSDALLKGPDIMKTLESAKHNALMTKSFKGSNEAPSKATETETSSVFGEITTCAKAYVALKASLEKNVDGFIEQSSKDLARSGVLSPYENYYKTVVANQNAGTYGSANGLVLQTAMVNSMGGAFRQAALQTGNNEAMMAANLTQAEQNQRTSWVSGFYTFNNMMGYVFTVLQAFIFAITPMIVVALMIPGMGKSIFTNYAQILIWLTLWSPMLAVVNFVITLFAMDGVQMVYSKSEGVTVSNVVAITDRTSNAIIAAQFLGTMTPMITWGIVKGAMAFTEFISAGVGTQFATAAAAQAAAGNYDSGKVGMNITSANTFSTAMSSSVGTQGVQAHLNASNMLASTDLGGSGVKANGSNATDNSSMVSQSVEQHAFTQQKSKMIQETMQASSSMQDMFSRLSAHSDQKVAQSVMSDIRSNMISKMVADGFTKTEAETATDQLTGSTEIKSGTSSRIEGGIKVGTGGLNINGGASAAKDWTYSNGDGASHADAYQKSKQRSNLNQVASVSSGGNTAATSQMAALSKTLTEQTGKTFSAGEAMAIAQSASTNYTDMTTYAKAVQTSRTLGSAHNMDTETFMAGRQATVDAAAHVDAKRAELSGNVGETPTDYASGAAKVLDKGRADMAASAAESTMQNPNVTVTAPTGGGTGRTAPSQSAIPSPGGGDLMGTINSNGAELSAHGQAIAGHVKEIRIDDNDTLSVGAKTAEKMRGAQEEVRSWK